MYVLKTNSGTVVGHCREIKKYGADSWRPGPEIAAESPGMRVHKLVQAKMRELGIKSYSQALEKVLSNPANKQLRAEFAKTP